MIMDYPLCLSFNISSIDVTFPLAFLPTYCIESSEHVSQSSHLEMKVLGKALRKWKSKWSSKMLDPLVFYGESSPTTRPPYY